MMACASAAGVWLRGVRHGSTAAAASRKVKATANKKQAKETRKRKKAPAAAGGEGTPAGLLATNGNFLSCAMQCHDYVAFLACVHRGVPAWVGQRGRHGATPAELAAHFSLSRRGASALMVTLCRMRVLRVQKDDAFSVDNVRYALTATAAVFLADPSAPRSTQVFCESFVTHFFDPDALWKVCQASGRDLMTEHTDNAVDGGDGGADSGGGAQHFMRHMDSQSWSCAEAFPTVLGLASRGGGRNAGTIHMLDVGGGSAVYSIAAARANPRLTGTVLELPQIKAITEAYIARAGVAGRVSVVAGDFFSDAPFPPADLVLFANILHDWSDDVVAHLLKQAAACTAPGGRVVISELLLADNISSSTPAATSMNVIVVPWTKGRQYRAKELFARVRAAGFVRPRVHTLVDDYSVVVAEKPKRVRGGKANS